MLQSYKTRLPGIAGQLFVCGELGLEPMILTIAYDTNI